MLNRIIEEIVTINNSNNIIIFFIETRLQDTIDKIIK